METGNELTAHITTGAAVVYAIQWAKESGRVPWLTMDSTHINRVVSAALAVVVAAGINWTYQNDGTLIVTGLTWSAVLGSAWEAFKQFTMQQLIFDGVVQQSGGRS